MTCTAKAVMLAVAFLWPEAFLMVGFEKDWIRRTIGPGLSPRDWLVLDAGKELWLDWGDQKGSCGHVTYPCMACGFRTSVCANLFDIILCIWPIIWHQLMKAIICLFVIPTFLFFFEIANSTRANPHMEGWCRGHSWGCFFLVPYLHLWTSVDPRALNVWPNEILHLAFDQLKMSWKKTNGANELQKELQYVA